MIKKESRVAIECDGEEWYSSPKQKAHVPLLMVWELIQQILTV